LFFISIDINKNQAKDNHLVSVTLFLSHALIIKGLLKVKAIITLIAFASNKFGYLF